MIINAEIANAGVLDSGDSWNKGWFFRTDIFSEGWEDVRCGLRGKMNNYWAVEIGYEIRGNEFYVLEGGLKKVDDGDSMELLSSFFDVHVEGDIMISEIFHLELWGEDVPIVAIKDYNFPGGGFVGAQGFLNESFLFFH